MNNKCIAAVLLIISFYFPALAVTINDPLAAAVSGSGTPSDPYILTITGSNNRITEKGLEQIRLAGDDAIWKAEHTAEGKQDYSLRFSGAAAAMAAPPLSLDVGVWQRQEGILGVGVGEKDSQYFPATLTLDVSGYSGFSEGAGVTVTGKTFCRAAVSGGKIEFTLTAGGDHTVVAAGVAPPAAQNTPLAAPEPEQTKAPEQSAPTVEAGTAELPFYTNFQAGQACTLTGSNWNEMREKRQTRVFRQLDAQGFLVWSATVSGEKMAEPPPEESFDISAVFDAENETIIFPQQGDFPGTLLYKVYVGSRFNNAQILSVQGEKLSTGAVVDRGYIAFPVTAGGAYRLKNTGKTVASDTQTEAKVVSEETGGNAYTQYSYKGSGRGTKDVPLTMLGKLDSLFHASWKSMNTIAGFSGGFDPTEASYDSSRVMKVMIEYRSPDTGRLIASIYIDGSQWRMTPESMKGPYYLNYTLNPTAAEIDAALSTHSLYTGKYADRKQPAAQLLLTEEKKENTALFFMSRTREFAGALNYTLYAGGNFKPGDIVELHYLLGSCNGELYHGDAPNNAELLLEEMSYTKYDTKSVVDAEGYVRFPIYTGGFYSISKAGETQQVPDTGLQSGQTQEGGTKAQTAENVAGDAEVKTAVLAKNNEKAPPEVNFRYRSSDGTVQMAGYLKNPEVTVSLRNENEKVQELQRLLPDGMRAAERYSVMLTDEKGGAYSLSDEEYLDISVALAGSYTVYDSERLFVQYLEQNGSVAPAVVASHAQMSDEGKMSVSFRAKRLGAFAVILSDSPRDKAESVMLKQEYVSEASTALAENSVKTPDKKKNIAAVLIFSIGLLLIFWFLTEKKRKNEGFS